MKNIVFLEELIQKFCEDYNENFFNFGILPTEINFYNSDKEKGKIFQKFLKNNKIKATIKIVGDTQIFEF
jgi:hypothetical protein